MNNQNGLPNNKAMELLPKRLKQMLQSRSLTVAELAKRTRVPVTTIHNWLSGQPPRNLQQVKTIADFFCVSVDYLAFGTTPKIDLEHIPEIILNGRFEVILRPTSKGE